MLKAVVKLLYSCTLIIAATLGFSYPTLAEEMSIYTLKVSYQSANELITTLQPFLIEGGYITSHNNKLVIRTTASNYAQLKLLADELDTAPIPLMISVKSGQALNQTTNQIQINGELIRKNSGYSTSTSKTGIRTSIHHSTEHRNNNQTHQVQVLEGHEAWINTGAQVPFRTHQTDIYGRSITTKSFKSVNQGFYARAWVVDNQVNITVRSNHDQLDTTNAYVRPSIDTNTIHTQLSGQLGQWLPVGIINTRDDQYGPEITGYRTGDRNNSSTVYIKVDTLTP